MSLAKQLRSERKGLILPPTQIQEQRRMSGGKDLDGSYFIEVEGWGRAKMSPQQALELSTAFLRALGFNIKFPEKVS